MRRRRQFAGIRRPTGRGFSRRRRAARHPFADRWNHNTAYYPLVADSVVGHRVVLDVGCGEGSLVRFLADRGHEVIGIDSDADVLPADVPGTHFLLADATRLPFPNDSFDAVISVMVLHHTRAELALVEMRRVLKPGGVLVDLGYARNRSLLDLAYTVRDVGWNLWQRLGKRRWEPDTVKAPARLGWQETRRLIVGMLPDAHWQRLPGWRYLATWVRPG